MRRNRKILFIVLPLLAALALCRKPFEPPAIRAANHYLAIDGTINTGPASETVIRLTRSASLTDSLTDQPELGASVSIHDDSGNQYALTDNASDGNYASGIQTLPSDRKYQVLVQTKEGLQYQTDPVSAQATPAIDSISWSVATDPTTGVQALKFFVDTHDPANATHFYRWDYVETWEHVSQLETPYYLVDDTTIGALPLDKSSHYCWSTGNSDHISIGSSVALAEDRISHAEIASFQQNDPKLDIGYSILVRQYALSLAAYNYWLGVQKNSQSLGGLYDLQPSQINGNFHSLSHPSDPALGFVSASAIQEKRFYLSNKSLSGWQSNPAYACKQLLVQTDPLNTLHYTYTDTSYAPYFFVSGPPPVLVVAPKECLYCTYQGGVTEKPSFWP